jgi:hypothetical protein
MKYLNNCGDLKYSDVDIFENNDKPIMQITITEKYAGSNLLQRFMRYSCNEFDDQQLLMIKKPLMIKNPQTAICPSNNFSKGY